MAVHLPLSKAAKEEARQLMMSNTNILGPKDGRLILSPSQDMVLGTYYLTKVKEGSVGEYRVLKDYNEMEEHLRFKNIKESSVVAIPLTMYKDKFAADIKAGYKYLITSVGRIIINDKLPKSFTYLSNVSENDHLIRVARDLIETYCR
jgi:DNA-directed RNA polymerase subunit beta'